MLWWSMERFYFKTIACIFGIARPLPKYRCAGGWQHRYTFSTLSVFNTFQIFDYSVDPENKEWTGWGNVIATYNSTPHVGIPNDAFVHTSSNGVSLSSLQDNWNCSCPVSQIWLLVCISRDPVFLWARNWVADHHTYWPNNHQPIISLNFFFVYCSNCTTYCLSCQMSVSLSCYWEVLDVVNLPLSRRESEMWALVKSLKCSHSTSVPTSKLISIFTEFCIKFGLLKFITDIVGCFMETLPMVFDMDLYVGA